LGQEARRIKELSQSEISGLLAGKGMGFAKPAELNGYPGPAHVLELASKLRLSEGQVADSKAIFQKMEQSAQEHGSELVRAERELEALFVDRQATPDTLVQAPERVASTKAKVRNAHLGARLSIEWRAVAPRFNETPVL
jgi:hypothetical protein